MLPINLYSRFFSPRKKTSFSKVPAIAIDSERVPLVPEMQEIKKGTVDSSTSAPSSVLKHADDFGRRRSRSSGPGKESEPLLTERSPDSRPDAGKTNVEFVPEIVEEGDAIILEETEIPRHGKSIRCKDDRRSRLPTPPPTKNVSFGELHEQNYLEQAILPPPLQFVPKHRHSGERLTSIYCAKLERSPLSLLDQSSDYSLRSFRLIQCYMILFVNVKLSTNMRVWFYNRIGFIRDNQSVLPSSSPQYLLILRFSRWVRASSHFQSLSFHSSCGDKRIRSSFSEKKIVRKK